MILLVRHAAAGQRDEWEGDDRLRPLNARGRRQADTLVVRLAAYDVERVVSSPYLRCLRTVEPLAKARGLEVEPRDELSEERMYVDGRGLLDELDGVAAVVCVHGGMETLVGFDGRFQKGGTLVLGPGLVPERYLPSPG